MSRHAGRTQRCGAADAQYGFYAIGPSELTRALRKARALVEFAEATVRR